MTGISTLILEATAVFATVAGDAGNALQANGTQVNITNRCGQEVVVIVHHQHAGGAMATHAHRIEPRRATGPMSHVAGTPLYFYAQSPEFTWSGSARRITHNGMTFDLSEARMRRAGGRLEMDLDCPGGATRGAEGSNAPLLAPAQRAAFDALTRLQALVRTGALRYFERSRDEAQRRHAGEAAREPNGIGASIIARSRNAWVPVIEFSLERCFSQVVTGREQEEDAVTVRGSAIEWRRASDPVLDAARTKITVQDGTRMVELAAPDMARLLTDLNALRSYCARPAS